MSRLRGVLPLALATVFGVVNGVWVFGPALKEQQEQKQVEAGKALRNLETEDIAITKAREGDDASISQIPNNSNVKVGDRP